MLSPFAVGSSLMNYMQLHEARDEEISSLCWSCLEKKVANGSIPGILGRFLQIPGYIFKIHTHFYCPGFRQ